MTLLSVCQTALRESGQFTVPETIVGNADPTAVQLLALANRAGRTLANDYRWQALLTTHTFDTVASTDSYALPSDFGRFANVTFWDETNYAPVRGPLSAMEWQALNSSSLAGSPIFDKAFRIAGGLFYLYPIPTAVETIAYTYYSSFWISGKSAFSLDADVALIDEDLITLELKWRWLQSKGDSFENEKREAELRRESVLAADGGRDVIRFSDSAGVRFRDGNLPTSGFGL